MMRALFTVSAVLLGTMLAPSVLAQDYAFLSANLYGEFVPGGGDEDASGDFNAEFNFADGQICYYLEINGVPDADGAVIEQGDQRTSGEVVVTLTLAGDDGDEVCIAVDAALQRQMADNADDYYVKVRSPEYPDGAIRGVLEN